MVSICFEASCQPVRAYLAVILRGHEAGEEEGNNSIGDHFEILVIGISVIGQKVAVMGS